MLTMTPPIPELIVRFEAERDSGNMFLAAQYAYVIAQRLRLEARMMEAREYAAKCLQIAESLPTDTLDDVTVQDVSIGGIQLPDIFHEGVIRTRLESLIDP